MPLGIELRYRGVHPSTVRGLLHGKRINHGFQCVDPGKRPRTRRDWQPNVQYKYLFSEALGRSFKLPVSTGALKSIDRAGGLDMYLLTVPAASKSSVVAEELRKRIVQEYRHNNAELPKKEGQTSILNIVDQRLRDAGLRPAKCSVINRDGVPASHTPTAQSPSTWQPTITVPHQNVAYRARDQRKAAVIKHLLAKKRIETRAEGGVFDSSAYARARKRACLRLRGLDRRQLMLKLPKSEAKMVERQISHMRAFSGLTTDFVPGNRLKQLTLSRVDEPTLEAVRRFKIYWRKKMKRRNALVLTKRGQTRNEAIRRIVSDPEACRIFRFDWLQNFVDEMPAGPGREAWRIIAEKYQPCVPGMLIDGTFIPASNHSCGSSLKIRDGVPPPVPPSLDSSLASEATDADVLAAARSVAFLPVDSKSSILKNVEALQNVPDGSSDDSIVNLYLSARTSRSVYKGRLRHLAEKWSDATAPQEERDLHPAFVGSRMRHGTRRKFKKICKWLDDSWLQRYIVPSSGVLVKDARDKKRMRVERVVLGNGIVLPSRPGGLKQETN